MPIQNHDFVKDVLLNSKGSIWRTFRVNLLTMWHYSIVRKHMWWQKVTGCQ